MGILRTKMEQALAVRGISARTGQNYLRFVAGLTRHYGRAPDTLTVAEVEAYLVHLQQSRQLSLRKGGAGRTRIGANTPFECRFFSDPRDRRER